MKYGELIGHDEKVVGIEKGVLYLRDAIFDNKEYKELPLKTREKICNIISMSMREVDEMVKIGLTPESKMVILV